MKFGCFLVILRNFIATVILLRIKPYSIIKVLFNLIAVRKAKIVYNFGLSECNTVNGDKCNMGVPLQKLPLICKSVSLMYFSYNIFFSYKTIPQFEIHLCKIDLDF